MLQAAEVASVVDALLGDDALLEGVLDLSISVTVSAMSITAWAMSRPSG